VAIKLLRRAEGATTPELPMKKDLAESEKSSTYKRHDAVSSGAKKLLVRLKAGPDYGKQDTEASRRRAENKARIYEVLKARHGWKKLPLSEKYNSWIAADDMMEPFDNLDIEKRHPIVVSAVLNPIVKQAREGRRDSLHLLALFAYEATRKLNLIASRDPDFAQLVSGFFVQWPILCRGVRELSDQQYQLLLSLGMLNGDQVFRDFRRFPELLRSFAETGGTPLKRMAILLFCWLDNCSSPWSERKQIKAGKTTKRSSQSDHDFHAELCGMTGGIPTVESLEAIRLEAENLPVFDAMTVKSKWWPLAKKLFNAFARDHPERISWLRKPVEDRSKVKHYGKTDGTIRAEIFKDLKKAFFNFVPTTRGRGRPARG
jgi:hypothetical protein